ncbi:zf-HC2 domain-containing protein [Paenibacillus filicis]|uniref:zf-HC2 domain-containing protein n=1 Tax=Paenibacillus filicis TaxID=669464 RepID=UPI00311A58D1
MIELMQRYLDQDLEETEYARMLGHLQQCPDCSELFERLVKVSTELESLPKVVPPYSLVDAILPEIERLEAEAGGAAPAWIAPSQEEAASQSTAVAEDPGSRPRSSRGAGWRSQMREWVSFPVLGGVVAAGLIFGFIVFQQAPPVSNKVAEELASKASQTKSEASSANQASGSAQGLAADTSRGASGQIQEQKSVPAAEDPGNTASQLQVTEQPKDPAVERSQKEPVESADKKPDAAADASQKPVTSMGAPQPPANPAQPSTQDPKPQEPVGNASKKSDTPAEKTGSLPDGAKHQEQYGQPTEGKAPIGPPVQAPPEADKAMGITSAGVADSSQEAKKRNEEQEPVLGPTFAVPDLAPAPKHELESADKSYKAAVKDNLVMIYDKNGKEAYHSKFDQWTGADRIELLSWNGLKLKYTVKMNEQTRTFEIDLKSQTEVEIKN